jgi:hypothetical protein
MQTLKLSNLESYISPNTRGTVVKRGEVVRVDDADAARMLEGFETRHSEVLRHWERVPDDHALHHDFTSPKTAAAPDPLPAAEAANAGAKTGQRVARKAAADQPAA